MPAPTILCCCCCGGVFLHEGDSISTPHQLVARLTPLHRQGFPPAAADLLGGEVGRPPRQAHRHLAPRVALHVVERTKRRPFASGVLTPSQGVCFLGFQLLLGLGILLQLNNYSRILGASSLMLVFSYPLMKRFTFWAYLGLTFNWGALLGWAAIRESLDPAIILPLYTAGICWALVYDTIYAHQDKEDDLKVGVKSTALRFGDSTKHWISGFGAACIGSLALSGYNADLACPYYPFLTAAAAQLAWQISTVDLSDRPDCNRKFVSNKWFGALVFGGDLFGRLAS